MNTRDSIYDVSFEIAGPAAMFTRPDTGAAPVSYPAPTYSASKGMFEAIARLKSAHIRPTKVEICAPLHYHHYTTNYGGPLRKGNQMSKGSSYQLIAIVLNDVCYRIYGVVEEVEKAPTDQTTNHLHYLQDKFRKRLQHGRWFQVPCLGWKEFTPSYVGPLRESTQVEESVDLVIPSMLFSVYGGQGDYCPTYKQQVHIVKGVLRYAE